MRFIPLAAVALMALSTQQMARADVVSPGVILKTEAAREMAKLFTPVTLDVRHEGKADKFTIIELLFCGGAGSSATVIAVATPGPPPDVLPPLALKAGDCTSKTPLNDVRSRIATPKGIPWMAALIGRIVYDQWTLSLSIDDAQLTTEKDINAAQIRDFLKNGGKPWNGWSTRGLSIPVAQGRPISFDLAVEFAASGVNVYAVPSGTPATWKLDDSKRFKVNRIPVGDLAVYLPFDFANSLSAQFVDATGLKLGNGADETIVHNLRVQPLPGGLTLRGDARNEHRAIQATVEVDLTGADLRVKEIRVRAPNEDCSTKSSLARFACNARNNAVNIVAVALGVNLTGQYENRSLIIGQKASSPTITLNGRSVSLDVIVSRFLPVSSGLYAFGAVLLEAK
jgi:hypothetical protein